MLAMCSYQTIPNQCYKKAYANNALKSIQPGCMLATLSNQTNSGTGMLATLSNQSPKGILIKLSIKHSHGYASNSSTNQYFKS